MNSLSECNWRLPSSGCSVYVSLTDPSTRAGEGLADRAALSLRDHEIFASHQILTADLLTDHLAFITYTQSARLWLPNLIFWIILITIFTVFRLLCSKMKIKTNITSLHTVSVISSLSYTNITFTLAPLSHKTLKNKARCWIGYLQFIGDNSFVCFGYS